ncbi:MAG: 3-oxoacyl-[acyl-carrier-protein] reductase [Rickettsiales bacterium]|jgi:3-oxoacyl-[acyl-carrier protein] reductase|nr:3-oxoacyl-[acyl-carrier-protein] reductase [Rickettsiales bacterium]
MLDFSGQKVLVTGATGGIGQATAELFAKRGAVVGLGGRNKEKLEKLASSLGVKTHIFSCDLGNIADVEELFDRADAEMGGIDVLVCNAGITKDMLAIRMTTSDFEDVITVNLKATFILNRSALKRMMKRRYGRIINISSITGVMGNAGQANYVASKAGMIGMSKSLAMEVASRGITVNCVAPGFIETPMTDVLTEEQKTRMLANIPIGKMGTPVDVANSIVFLASREAGYITGQTLHINGGMLMV